MPWFRVDDDFDQHPKADAAGNRALGLWVRAGAYSARLLTEGFVPGGMVPKLGGTKADALALVQAGLWESVDGGYLFHQWEERQPTKTQVQADRAAAAERQRRARDKAKAERERALEPASATSTRHAVTHGVSHGPPGPARPVTSTHLLTLISRLAARNAQGPPPAEVISAWQDHAGPAVDLDHEAAAYLMRFGDRPAKDERGAWLGWLATARRRTEQTARKASCVVPGCLNGWLPEDAGRAVPCPTCKPHLRPVATEAS